MDESSLMNNFIDLDQEKDKEEGGDMVDIGDFNIVNTFSVVRILLMKN